MNASTPFGSSEIGCQDFKLIDCLVILFVFKVYFIEVLFSLLDDLALLLNSSETG